MASYALLNKMNVVILVLENFEEDIEEGDARTILGSIEKWEEYYTKQLNHLKDSETGNFKVLPNVFDLTSLEHMKKIQNKFFKS